jgi:transcriptional regulator with XRE-family HTH domain
MDDAQRLPANHVGRLIDDGLKRRGFSDQAELAKRCGVTKSYISKFKHGQIRNPSEKVLSCLAVALGQSATEYRLALMADRGELPPWIENMQVENGVRLTDEDKHVLERLVTTFIDARRGNIEF